MAQKAIREFDGKNIIGRYLATNTDFRLNSDLVHVGPDSDIEKLPSQFPWLLERKLVAKPDQLIKRRGKSGLLLLNADWEQAKQWLLSHRGRAVEVDGVSGVLSTFLVEPFVPHRAEDEYYVCIRSTREADEILFTPEGGVDVGDVDAKARRLSVPVDALAGEEQVAAALLDDPRVPEARRARLAAFIAALHRCFAALHFAYLEINPLVVDAAGALAPLDLAAKLDECARFECARAWAGGAPGAHALDFPPPFGRPLLPEEEFVAELDAKTGASLKLTVLNPDARLWTMVAGGGASVIYADTVSDLGGGADLANYGEYSGDPSETLTFEYARTVLRLLLRARPAAGRGPKILLVGGGIANFTNVAETFKGIIRALTEFSDQLIQQDVHIYIRRGGPNYQEALSQIRNCALSLNLPHVFVYGPETHITAIVAMALGVAAPADQFAAAAPASPPSEPSLASSLAAPAQPVSIGRVSSSSTLSSSLSSVAEPADASSSLPAAPAAQPEAKPWYQVFSKHTRALVYGMQPGAVQNMLDFDFICSRPQPSVAAIVYEFSPSHHRRFYWGSREVQLPVYSSLAQALARFPEVDTVVSFASSRSVFESTREMLGHAQLRTIALIAEGVPERRTRQLIAAAAARQPPVLLIGPATVGGIKPGAFRIGNTGGMLDNILASKLYRPGSVAYVSRSGGLSNELNNIISRCTDGVYEGVAIGGDRYPGSLFLDHLLRFQADPDVKLLVLLGEVGGEAEYDVACALQDGRITKPLVAWCTGTVAKMFSTEVQFGHAGALAQGQRETADAKNAALRAAGAVVPSSFDEFHLVLARVFQQLLASGAVQSRPEPEPPKIPVDYHWARKLGLIRKQAAFVSTISDERGDELTYAGMPLSAVFEQQLGVGGVLGLLWFRKRLPPAFARFIEMVLMVTADHGPAVAGAHNTIVTARAGKDLVSSLAAGLLTIGPRFGGALDDSAAKFCWAFDRGLTPDEFVEHMRRQKELIPGIGHKVKSLQNPDKRVQILVRFAQEHFAPLDLLEYALAVERITTRKKANLILNVDGAIACIFVDLLRGSGVFTREEADAYIFQLGFLNGLFVLGRSIGFIGHFLDQRRLNQGLYRHPDEDIAYLDPSDDHF